jgi:hypothetical protein
MTVVEIQTKIDQFEKLMTKADVIEKADLQMIVDDLETERIKLLTAGLRELSINIDTNDLQELDNIADSFKQGTLEIKNQTELIGQAISIGKNLVSKFT